MNTRSLVSLLLLAIATGFLLTGCRPAGDAARVAAKYHCPMHPTYVSDRPGDCPICNMKLVPIKDAPAPVAAQPAAQPSDGTTQYHCPNHPDYFFDEPGLCGICDTKLEAVPSPEAAAHLDAKPDAAPAAVPGLATVMVSPEKQQLIGLRTAPVERRQLTTGIRATAVAEHDETKLARITLRFSGWVQTLAVNATGQHVPQGEPLMTVYSPELLSAENEFLIARRQLERAKSGGPAEERESAQRLVDSARRRLELWQIGDQEIRELEQRGKASDELVVRSPVSGHVLSKTAVAGRAFMAGETLYEVGALTPIWLRVSVFEQDFARLRVGQAARAAFPALANRAFETRVSFIYPHLDPATRRGEVRIEMDNPNHEILPDMWANIDIETTGGESLAVPASAVIDSGARQVVFVRREDNHLEPRVVRIGERTDEYWQVLDGVKEGERVVSRALFLVDSESQLRAAMAGMQHEH